MQLIRRFADHRLAANLETVLERPDDLEARGEMLLGAHYAGAAIEESMLGAAHSCANPLTAHFDVVHGAAVGAMMPAVLRYNAETAAEVYGELGGAEELASRVEGFLRAAGLPTQLRDHGVTEDSLTNLAREASKQWTAQFNPREVDEASLLEIYRCVF